MRFGPQDPIWPNRDRFILSAGHASVLLFSLRHLTGVRVVSRDYETLAHTVTVGGRNDVRLIQQKRRGLA